MGLFGKKESEKNGKGESKGKKKDSIKSEDVFDASVEVSKSGDESRGENECEAADAGGGKNGEEMLLMGKSVSGMTYEERVRVVLDVKHSQYEIEQTASQRAVPDSLSLDEYGDSSHAASVVAAAAAARVAAENGIGPRCHSDVEKSAGVIEEEPPLPIIEDSPPSPPRQPPSSSHSSPPTPAAAQTPASPLSRVKRGGRRMAGSFAAGVRRRLRSSSLRTTNRHTHTANPTINNTHTTSNDISESNHTHTPQTLQDPSSPPRSPTSTKTSLNNATTPSSPNTPKLSPSPRAPHRVVHDHHVNRIPKPNNPSTDQQTPQTTQPNRTAKPAPAQSNPSSQLTSTTSTLSLSNSNNNNNNTNFEKSSKTPTNNTPPSDTTSNKENQQKHSKSEVPSAKPTPITDKQPKPPSPPSPTHTGQNASYNKNALDFAQHSLLPQYTHPNSHTTAKSPPPPTTSWSQISGTTFSVRSGPNYSRNKVKRPSNESLCQIIAVRAFASNTRTEHIVDVLPFPTHVIAPNGTQEGKHQNTAEHFLPDIFVFHVQLPFENPNMFRPTDDGRGGEVIHYLKPSQRFLDEVNGVIPITPASSLFLRWCQECDTKFETRCRFKCMALVSDLDKLNLGWVKPYNGKPVLVTKSGHVRKGVRDGIRFLEFRANIHAWSFLAKKSFVSLIPRFKDMQLGFGFTIEAQDENEMPECILGAVGMNFIDVTTFPSILPAVIGTEAVVNGKHNNNNNNNKGKDTTTTTMAKKRLSMKKNDSSSLQDPQQQQQQVRKRHSKTSNR